MRPPEPDATLEIINGPKRLNHSWNRPMGAILWE